MRVEKEYISKEYIGRLNSSPFFIAADYLGLTVGQFSELRKRLVKAGAEIHVVKNSIFRRAAEEAGVADLAGSLTGQMAIVTGQRDISAAAKVMKSFQAEFDRPKIKFGYLNKSRLEEGEIKTLAELPSIEVLHGKLLGTLNGPAAALVGILAAPARQLLRVLQARVEKGAD